MSVAVYTKSGGKSTSKVSLPKAVFAATLGSHQLIKDVYQAEYANERTTLADTKNRSAVRGGGRKPWRQKGTGRARAGTIRSPLWRGGGIVFGPSPNRNFSKKVNRTTRAKVLAQALTLAVKHDRVAVIETLDTSGKTKDLAQLLTKLDFSRGLIVVDELTDSLKRAANNLRGIEVTGAASVSVRAVLEADQLLITKPALASLDQRLGVKS